MNSWYAHVTVATVVERDGRFLLVEERSNDQIAYNQPAGHLERHESLIEAAIRETREETRWIVEPDHVLGLNLYESPNNQVTYLRVTFAARPIAENPLLPLDDDIIAAHWLSYEEVLALSYQLRSPLVLKDIEQYRAGVRYPLDIVSYIPQLNE